MAIKDAEIPLTLSSETGIPWGRYFLPHKAANTHFCFVGSTGSGKTVSIRLLMQTTLSLIGAKGLHHNALIYDAKSDYIAILRGMSIPPERIKTSNPFDDDGCAWDMAKDITERAHAQELATILIPPEPNSQQPFFGDAARHLLEGVITALMLTTKQQWSFRDVVYVMGAKERIEEVLNWTAETREIIPMYFGNDETANNIMSTVATKTKSYKIIAALWDRAFKLGKTFSLTEWLERDYILLLGNDETARTAIDSINQAIFKRTSQIILAVREDNLSKNYINLGSQDSELAVIPIRRHWIFLDEVRNAGRLEGLTALMTKGRSKGAAIVLGFQDVEGLRAVYGQDEANEVIGQCSNYAILRLQSPGTTEWASSLFGYREMLEQYDESSSSISTPNEWFATSTITRGDSVRYAYRDKKIVLPSEFMYADATNNETGLTGWYFTSYLPMGAGRSHKARTPGFLLFGSKEYGIPGWLCKEDENYCFEPRDGKYQELEEWSLEDLDELAPQSEEDINFERLFKGGKRKAFILNSKANKKFRGRLIEEIAEYAFLQGRDKFEEGELEELAALGKGAETECRNLLFKKLAGGDGTIVDSDDSAKNLKILAKHR